MISYDIGETDLALSDEINMIFDKKKENMIANSTKEQLLMRKLEDKARESYELKQSLPPFKYGFENVPVITYQHHWHAPDYLGILFLVFFVCFWVGFFCFLCDFFLQKHIKKKNENTTIFLISLLYLYKCNFQKPKMKKQKNKKKAMQNVHVNCEQK